MTSLVLVTRTAIPSFAACVYGTSQLAVPDVTYAALAPVVAPSLQLPPAYTMGTVTVSGLVNPQFSTTFCGGIYTKGCWLTSPF